MQCPSHPEFDPKNEKQFEGNRKYLDCRVCCGLHYGTKPIGHFNGEYVANARDKATARVVLGPMDLEQFGHARYSFGFAYHMSDGPSWHADRETRTIYFERDMSSRALESFKQYNCRVASLKWSEPKVMALDTEKQTDAVVLILKIGSVGQQLKLKLKEGMTVSEVANAFDQLMTQLRDVPKDNVVEKVASS
jgi:hypothetical protein